MEVPALRFHGIDDLRLESVTLPVPGQGAVLARVDACGVCGSDLHFLDGSARTGTVPVTLGHEIAATVLHSNDPAWSGGQSAVIAPGITCGECPSCRRGRENLCESLTMIGVDVDGGLAGALVVPGSALISRPPALSPEVAATAVDAGATAYHAVARRGEVQPGDAVAVIGIGGLGTFALQIAKMLGAAPVIAVDIDPGALDRALSLGADEVITAEEGPVGRAVKLLTDGGVDVALEFVGRAATVDAAVKSLRRGGRAVATGVGIERLETLPPVLWATQEYEMRGSFGSLAGDPERILAWLDDGTLQPPPLHPITLDEAAGEIPRWARTGTHPPGRPMVVP